MFPIFQSAAYTHDPSGATLSYDDIKYARCNNTPAHQVLNTKMASLHGAEAAMVTASGLSAITTTLMTFVKVHAPPQICISPCPSVREGLLVPLCCIKCASTDQWKWMYVWRQNGEHIIAQSALYGGTQGAMTKDFPGFGISHTLVSGQVDPYNFLNPLLTTLPSHLQRTIIRGNYSGFHLIIYHICRHLEFFKCRGV